jgi:hypothetical protein
MTTRQAIVILVVMQYIQKMLGLSMYSKPRPRLSRSSYIQEWIKVWTRSDCMNKQKAKR